MTKTRFVFLFNFFMNFFGKVVMEFIWLLFTMTFGMYVVGQASGIDLNPIIQTYSSWMVVVLFNAALARYVIAYMLEWIDKELDRGIEQRRQIMDQIKLGFRLAFLSLFKKDAPHDPNEQ